MKKSFVRAYSILLAVSMLVFLFAGCSTKTQDPAQDANVSDKQNADKQPASGGSQAPQETMKPATFKVVFDFNLDPKGMSLTDNEYTRFIKEKTGVQIQIESPGSSGYYDKLNILMASGSYPDAFMADRNRVMQFAGDDLLMDLAPIVKDAAKYPNIKKYLPEEAWTPVTEKDKIWAFPYNRQDAINQVVYVKKEWMAKLGLKAPKTLDEYYEVMKAFTEKDPDGNGKNDTFGLLASSGMQAGGRIFSGVFDCNTYKIRDGKVTPPEITPEYKEFLKYMNMLVKDKIMDPEFPTINTSIYMDKLKTGKYGLTANFWHGDQMPEYKNDRKVHEAWDTLEMPVKKDGYPAKFSYNSVNRHYIAVPKTTKNADALIRMFDWVLSPEGTKFVYLGIENVEYKITNGKIDILKQKFPTHWMFSLVKHGQLSAEVKTYMESENPKQSIERLELATKSGQLDKLQAALPYYPELTSFDLGKIVEEYTVKAILGNTDIDQSWDEYVNKWRTAGGDKAIQFWTDWYNKEGKNMVK